MQNYFTRHSIHALGISTFTVITGCTDLYCNSMLTNTFALLLHACNCLWWWWQSQSGGRGRFGGGGGGGGGRKKGGLSEWS